MAKQAGNTTPGALVWLCISAGTTGTLSGVTASTVSGSNVLIITAGTIPRGGSMSQSPRHYRKGTQLPRALGIGGGLEQDLNLLPGRGITHFAPFAGSSSQMLLVNSGLTNTIRRRPTAISSKAIAQSDLPSDGNIPNGSPSGRMSDLSFCPQRR